MKKTLALVNLVFNVFVALSQTTPKVCVATASVPECNSNTLGFVTPCGTVPFVATNYLPVPTGYAAVAQYE